MAGGPPLGQRLEAYHRFYVQEILPWKVAEFLIFSDSFPRSLHCCVLQVDELPAADRRGDLRGARTEAAKAARRLMTDLASLTIAEVLERGLHEFLLDVQLALERIGDEVVKTTMFYSSEFDPEEQQQQQQQQ